MVARLIQPILAVFAVLLTMNAAAAVAMDDAAMGTDLGRVEHEWARVTYQVKSEDEQDQQMRALLAQAEKLVARYPSRAEPLIWEGVIASSEAKYAGTFSALGFAKQARDLFEKAGRLDFRALDGAVPTSLGALYYKVPGFPIGFGDNDKARMYLEQGIQINPTGLDANFFYGDFLYQKGEYAKAAAVLKRALKTPADSNRPVWDAGRRAEIQTLLMKVGEKLASNG